MPAHLRIKHRCCVKALIGFCVLAAASPSLGQDSGGAQGSAELGFHSGPLLPSRVPGVREIVPGWGLRGSLPTSKGVFEADTFIGKGSGTTYYSGSFDYRMDLENDIIPAHLLLGVHADSYSGPNRGSSYSGGWHFGGGTTQPIAGPILFRADFKYRFGPGNTVYVGVGFVYRFSSGASGGASGGN